MLQLLLFLALGPVAYVAFRLYIAAAKVIFNFVLLLIFMIALVILSISNKSAPSNTWSPPIPTVTTEQTQVTPCDEVEQLLTEPIWPGELCDRYYKGPQCKTEIEAVFERAGLQLSPAAMCGTVLPPPAPSAPLPESFDSLATKFLQSVPKADRNLQFEKLHDFISPSTKSSLILDDVRFTCELAAYLSFVKPTGDALMGLNSATRTTDSSVVLNQVPMLAPFVGIVRGVYEKNSRRECTARLRDHSLCIERDDNVKCNVYEWKIAENEQVCVDYLIR